jgi:hypothetical protein
MRRRGLTRIHSLAAILASLLCSRVLAQATPSKLVGAWQIVLPSALVPEACRGSFVEFKDDGTLVTHSGALLLTADYSATPKGQGFLVVESNLRSNDKPNCQGVPARNFIDRFVHRAYFEIRGDTLHKYADETRAREYFAMTRMAQPAAAVDSTRK